MRHLRKGRKLKRTSSHRHALLRNLASALLEHERIETTVAKAKELRPFVEKLITRAKVALQKEEQKLLPAGQTVDIHNRRMVARDIRDKGVVQKLFTELAEKVKDRDGGYTRIVKLAIRRGDNAQTALIELVDSDKVAPKDGAVHLRKKKKTSKTVTETKQTVETTKTAPAPAPEVEDVKIEEEVPEVAEVNEVATDEVNEETKDENTEENK